MSLPVQVDRNSHFNNIYLYHYFKLQCVINIHTWSEDIDSGTVISFNIEAMNPCILMEKYYQSVLHFPIRLTDKKAITQWPLKENSILFPQIQMLKNQTNWSPKLNEYANLHVMTYHSETDMWQTEYVLACSLHAKYIKMLL